MEGCAGKKCSCACQHGKESPESTTTVKTTRQLSPQSINSVVAFSVVSPEIKQAIESVKYIAENMRSRNEAKEVSCYPLWPTQVNSVMSVEMSCLCLKLGMHENENTWSKPPNVCQVPVQVRCLVPVPYFFHSYVNITFFLVSTVRPRTLSCVDIRKSDIYRMLRSNQVIKRQQNKQVPKGIVDEGEEKSQ